MPRVAGLSVCLVEQDDLAAHTSSASTKLIHGGLRYLEQGELRLVREALAERERLLAIAPHIVRPMRFVLPYIDGLRPRWLLRLGLFVYDHAGGREKLAASSSTRLAGTALGAPLRAGIRDGFEYSDCAVDDSRLVVLNALDAAERGAQVLHATPRGRHRRHGDGQWQVTTEDRNTGARESLRARAVVNATGAWVNDLLQLAGIKPRQHLRLVKGSHLILKQPVPGRSRLPAAEPGPARGVRDPLGGSLHAGGHHRRAVRRRSGAGHDRPGGDGTICSRS